MGLWAFVQQVIALKGCKSVAEQGLQAYRRPKEDDRKRGQEKLRGLGGGDSGHLESGDTKYAIPVTLDISQRETQRGGELLVLGRDDPDSLLGKREKRERTIEKWQNTQRRACGSLTRVRESKAPDSDDEGAAIAREDNSIPNKKHRIQLLRVCIVFSLGHKYS